MSATAKPEPVTVGPLTVYPERPPTPREPEWWWRGYTCIDGRKDKPVFGRGDRETISKAARVWVHDHVDAPESASAPVATGYTVRDVCELWLGRKAAERDAGQIKQRSYLAYQASVRRLISRKRAGTIGDLKVDPLQETEIEEYALARKAAGHAPKTINDDVSVLMMAIGYARRKRWTTCPDLRPRPLKAAPKRPTRTPTREEIVALIDVLPERYGLLIWLMYATGARIGEIAHLEWSDVSGSTVTLGLHQGAEKTGARTVPLPPEVVARLREWRARPAEPRRQGFKPIDPATAARWVIGVKPVSSISRTLKLLRPATVAVAERLGLDPTAARWTSHAIRRWAVDEAGRVGMEPAAAASQFGHSPEMMVRRYRRPGLADRERVVVGAQLGAVATYRRV